MVLGLLQALLILFLAIKPNTGQMVNTLWPLSEVSMKKFFFYSVACILTLITLYELIIILNTGNLDNILNIKFLGLVGCTLFCIHEAFTILKNNNK